MSATEPPSLLAVDWPAYHRLIECLAAQVHESGYRFDSLLCLARGGLRPGDVLSRVFDVPLAILAASSYRAAGGTLQGELDIARFITTTGADLHGRVLLVDDLADTGATIERVRVHLRRRYPAITEIRTAVLWVKEGACVVPEYAVVRLPDRPWIRQPFETYDSMSPEEVCRRVRSQDRADSMADSTADSTADTMELRPGPASDSGFGSTGKSG